MILRPLTAYNKFEKPGWVISWMPAKPYERHLWIDRIRAGYISATGHSVWLVRSHGTVYHSTFVPRLHCQRSKTCSRYICFLDSTSATNCFAEYEQRIRRPCNDSNHVTAPYKLSFYYYYYLRPQQVKHQVKTEHQCVNLNMATLLLLYIVSFLCVGLMYLYCCVLLRRNKECCLIWRAFLQ